MLAGACGRQENPPREYTAEELGALAKQSLDLAEAGLILRNPGSSGTYSGTGRTTDGKRVRITVVMDEKRIYFHAQTDPTEKVSIAHRSSVKR
jgi:hypothetical protein